MDSALPLERGMLRLCRSVVVDALLFEAGVLEIAPVPLAMRGGDGENDDEKLPCWCVW